MAGRAAHRTRNSASVAAGCVAAAVFIVAVFLLLTVPTAGPDEAGLKTTSTTTTTDTPGKAPVKVTATTTENTTAAADRSLLGRALGLGRPPSCSSCCWPG